MNKIAKVLLEVDDWKGLASELEISAGDVKSIEANCKDSSAADLAKCYRRGLVQIYCDSTGLDVELVAEAVASALETLGNRKQANNLRKLYPSASRTESKTKKLAYIIFWVVIVQFLQVIPLHQLSKESLSPEVASTLHRITMTFKPLLLL